MNAEIDVSGVTLKTDRLVLRPWREEDLEDFFEYASVDGVGQMAGWPPHQTRQDSRRVLDRFIRNKKTFALELGGKVIGSLGIEKYDEDRFPELSGKRCRQIGFVLAKPYWGRGLMPEAVEAALEYLFSAAGLDAVLCGRFIRNAQSGRVQEKCGFRHYAFYVFKTAMGTEEDEETNILTREEWALRRRRA